MRKIIASAALAAALVTGLAGGWIAGHRAPAAQLHGLMGACVHGQSVGIDAGTYRCEPVRSHR